MAIPKVFISSTCFDLNEIREQLNRFIYSYGFEPILSEYGDVFYHPDLHTHEACVHEVANCQLFILIIGGRFGGEYTRDKSKSITNAEYDAARENKIPVFSYVRKAVLSNQHIYKQNKSKKFVSEIDYPSIEKQEYAIDIFDFIDSVRRSPVNNALEGFDNFLEIENHLRKQWAGMFFDFLKSREVKSQIDATNHLLSSISSSSEKLEELVKSFYRSMAEESAEESIESVEVLENIKQFFNSIVLDDTEDWVDIFGGFDIDSVSKVNPIGKEWYEYLNAIGFFKLSTDKKIKPRELSTDRNNNGSSYAFILNKDAHQEKEMYFNQGVLKSSDKQRAKVLKKFIK